MDAQDKAVWSWEGGPMPPSRRRIDPRGWIAASVLGGMGAFALALWILWRPIPGLPPPLGAWQSHALHWLALACHAASSHLCAGPGLDYAAFWSRLSAPERAGVAVRGALAAIAACLPAILLSRPMLLPRDGLIHLRGSRRHEGKLATDALRKTIGAASKDHEIAPGVAYPASLWTRGVLIVGGVGSGKSTLLRRIVDKVVSSREQMLLFDAKGEFTSGWLGPAIIAPWDARSLAWDIARDARNVLEMEAFAAAMVKESSDPMWSSASRQILVGLMLRLRGLRGDDWGWAELRDSLRMPQPELLDAMRTWHPIAARSLAKASVTSAGILINLSAFCAPIFHLAEAWGAHPPSRRISIAAWTMGKSRHRQLILQGHGAYSDLAMAVAKGVLGVFSALIASSEMSDDGQAAAQSRRKIYLIADELAELGEFPMRLFAMGRSRGLRCVAACQDLSQLEKIHGAPAVKALVSMVGTLIVGRTMQGESAELLCKAFGSREVERANVSTPQGSGAKAGSLSFAREEVPLYKPSELSSRLGLSRDGKSVKLILFTGGSAYELAWPVFDMASARPAHLPVPWLSRRPEPMPMEEAASAPTTPSVEAPPFCEEPPIPFDDASASDEPGEPAACR